MATIKRVIEPVQKIELEVSADIAFKIGKNLYDGLRKSIFSDSVFKPGDTVQFSINDLKGEEKCVLTFHLIH